MGFPAGSAALMDIMPRGVLFSISFVFFNEELSDPHRALSDDQSRLGEALRRVSLLISDGNITVFEELAWPFTSFINTFKRDWVYDDMKLEEFMDEHFQRGSLTEGGQDYLIEAFTAYYKARFETDPKRKSEYILQGNLLVGLHEQTRLQPQIEQSMAVPLQMFSDGSGNQVQEAQKGSALTRIAVSRAITQMLMLISLPSRELKLNQNVIAPTGVVSYPRDLLQIRDPRCLELVRMFETGQDTLSGSGAENWSALSDRMSFVVDFFRSHQQDKRMREAPFSPEQEVVIESGHFPAGPL